MWKKVSVTRKQMQSDVTVEKIENYFDADADNKDIYYFKDQIFYYVVIILKSSAVNA